MPKQERSPDDVHDLYHVQVGKPYRGQMVTLIEIQDPVDLPKYPSKVKVRRLIHLENGIIVLEDTIFDRGEIYNGEGIMLPLADIQFPQLNPEDFKSPKGAGEEEDPEAKKKKQEILRQKAKELLNKRRPSLVQPDDDVDDSGDDKKEEEEPNKDNMTVRVQTPDGKIVSLAVTPSDSIQKIKDQLMAKEHNDDIPIVDDDSNMELTFQGNPLEDPDDTLDDYGIQNGNLLKLIVKLDEITIHVQVHTPNGNRGKTIPIQVIPAISTVDDIKGKLEQDYGIPKQNQRLQYDGNDLDNEPKRILKDVGIINDGDVIDLMPAQIKVKTTPNGKLLLVVSVDPSIDTVPDLKQRIAEEHGIPAKNQDLSFKGKPLADDDDSKLKDLSISHGDVVDMVDDNDAPRGVEEEKEPASNERVRTLSPNSVWVYPTAESAPQHGTPNNLQGIWAVPPAGEDASKEEPVEVNIHPLHKEPVGDKKSLHGAYGYINGAKPDVNGVIDPANIVFYPPEQKEFRPDFEQVGWWSNPNASSETYVSYKWVGADCYYTKTHTVTLMGHTVTFKSEWVE